MRFFVHHHLRLMCVMLLDETAQTWKPAAWEFGAVVIMTSSTGTVQCSACKHAHGSVRFLLLLAPSTSALDILGTSDLLYVVVDHHTASHLHAGLVSP
jgi:hypothetical protein